MPLTYTIDGRLKIVIARASGVLSEEDLRGSREQIQSDPAYSPSFAQLFDLSDVTDIEVSIPVMARIAGSSAVSPNARRPLSESMTFSTRWHERSRRSASRTTAQSTCSEIEPSPRHGSSSSARTAWTARFDLRFQALEADVEHPSREDREARNLPRTVAQKAERAKSTAGAKIVPIGGLKRQLVVRPPLEDQLSIALRDGDSAF